jgi:hypothetical protein
MQSLKNHMEELPTKHIVIVDHRKDWRDAIESKIRDVYHQILSIKVGTLLELSEVLRNVNNGIPVRNKDFFPPKEEIIPRIDMVAIAVLKKDSPESVSKFIDINGDIRTLDLSLVLDTAPDTAFLENDFMKNRIAELLAN